MTEAVRAEGLVKTFVGGGFAADFQREVAGRLTDPAARNLIESVLGDAEAGGGELDLPLVGDGDEGAYGFRIHPAIQPRVVRGCRVGCLIAGRGSGFSLEAPEGVRFLIRSRVIGT